MHGLFQSNIFAHTYNVQLRWNYPLQWSPFLYRVCPQKDPTWNTKWLVGQPGNTWAAPLSCDSQVVTGFPLYFGEPTRLTELNDNICPKLQPTHGLNGQSQTHHLLHLWPHTWQFLEDDELEPKGTNIELFLPILLENLTLATWGMIISW